MNRNPAPFTLQRNSPDEDSERLPLVVIYDSPQTCPYLDGRVARMPLEYPRRPLSPEDLDRLLEQGYRRTGSMVYRTRCPSCQECIPTRVPVDEFRYTRSLRRVLNRGERELTIRVGQPRICPDRVRMFNDHRKARDLSRNGPVTEADYYEFLVASCVTSVELSFERADELIGIAILDCGADSLNAVYTHFRAEFSRYSVGTLAILKQIEMAQRTHRRYVYLGLYVAENDHLNYKARFTPQERLVDGVWQRVQPDG